MWTKPGRDTPRPAARYKYSKYIRRRGSKQARTRTRQASDDVRTLATRDAPGPKVSSLRPPHAGKLPGDQPVETAQPVVYQGSGLSAGARLRTFCGLPRRVDVCNCSCRLSCLVSCRLLVYAFRDVVRADSGALRVRRGRNIVSMQTRKRLFFEEFPSTPASVRISSVINHCLREIESACAKATLAPGHEYHCKCPILSSALSFQNRS